MATNNFKPFATGTGANVLSQTEYEALAALAGGFTSGKASSAQINKAIRQATFIAAALAQYVTNKSGQDVLDDGDVTAFITKMATAFGQDFQALDAGLTSLAALAGGANMLPYYTAADVFAQTSFTAVGRALVGQSTAAAALSYLAGAPLASPALTGTPTAPTAAAGTATDQIATMNALLNGMALYGIGGAGATTPTYTIHPADIANTSPTRIIQALNTEDQTTVGSPVANQSFGGMSVIRGIRPAQFGVSGQGAAATFWYRGFSTALALQSDWLQLATTLSPTFTGTPTAPTAVVGTNTTQLATTAFVQAAQAYYGFGATPTLRSTLDWQSDTLDIGQTFSVVGTNITNLPAGMTDPGALVVLVSVRAGFSTVGRIIDVCYSTTTLASYQLYELRMTGNAGNRTFTVRSIFNNSSTIPIANGGTGATTAAGALTALGAAPLASPTFTGTPAAPTASIGDNSTQVATTAFVQAVNTGLVGATRNGKMSVTAASASATFTADEIIVADSLAGRQFRLASFSQTINLASSGAGGMDTGTVPAAGYVALYAIYNPTSGVAALLAVNATSATAPEIYGGSNLPSGYTASALVSVWRTSGSQFTVGIQSDRKLSFPQQAVLSSSVAASSYTSLSCASCVPLNAKKLDGIANVNISGSGYNTQMTVAASSSGIGVVYVGCGGAAIVASFSSLALITAQTVWYTLTAGTTLQTSYIYITGYEI